MNLESNYDTINRSFLIAQNSDRFKLYLENKNSNLKNFESILPYLLKEKSDQIENNQSWLEDKKTIKFSRELNNKHPLEFSWSFWFYKTNRNNNWIDNLVYLCTVDFVEDFWSVYNHLKPVEYLSDGCDYAFFKKGIRPMWEDKSNESGGRWLLNIEKCSNPNFLNNIWLNSLLSLIGSHYDQEIKYINGMVLSIRFKSNKLALWTNKYEDKIIKRFKKEINLYDSTFLFEIHKN